MKTPKDPFRDYVLHPRYGKRPRITGLNPGSRPPAGIPSTAIEADTERQVSVHAQRAYYFDEKRVCVDCERPFIFFAEEQRHWFEELGFSVFAHCVRCTDCRKAIQAPARLKEEYDELLAIESRTAEQDLSMSKLLLDLIECGSFLPHKTEQVRRILKRLPNQEPLWGRVLAIEAAERQGPGAPAILVQRYPPSADALFRLCSSLLTTDMVREISEADYGYGADLNFDEIQRIRAEGVKPDTLAWNPCEVLELIRWSQPEREDWKPGSSGERGHIMRAFCCAALLSAAALPENEGHYNSEDDTLIQLIESAVFLRGAMPGAVIQFLLWRIPRDNGHEPFLSLGLLILALHPITGPCAPAQVSSVIRYVEGFVLSYEKSVPKEFRFFCGLKHELWAGYFEAIQKRYRGQRLRSLLGRVTVRPLDSS